MTAAAQVDRGTGRSSAEHQRTLVTTPAQRLSGGLIGVRSDDTVAATSYVLRPTSYVLRLEDVNRGRAVERVLSP
jgi:hypothetical protein